MQKSQQGSWEVLIWVGAALTTRCTTWHYTLNTQMPKWHVQASENSQRRGKRGWWLPSCGSYATRWDICSPKPQVRKWKVIKYTIAKPAVILPDKTHYHDWNDNTSDCDFSLEMQREPLDHMCKCYSVSSLFCFSFENMKKCFSAHCAILHLIIILTYFVLPPVLSFYDDLICVVVFSQAWRIILLILVGDRI